MAYFVGAYASSPNTSGWNATLESEYYQQLKTLKQLKGLEHPFVGSLHPHDDQWFLDNIDPAWDYVFTCVPGIMNALSQNPHFGLASENENGRAAALTFMQQACDAIGKLNAHLGRNAVKAIQIQTAPNQNNALASAAALQASLSTMLSWNWHGAQLVIEHCDTLVAGQTPAKGFLSLDAEIQVLQAVNQQSQTPIGIVINWGRSVLELRHPDGALQHIQQAKDDGLLSGVMFSGASDQDTEYGVWKDTHMPPAPSDKVTFGAAHSLMTESQMHQCLTLADANTLSIVGIKLGIRPRDTSLADRIGYIRDGLGILQRWS
ncbi:DUF4862 family protein [Neptunicella sp.]|uniref:DUF4862 family protein n=1 Tax=Neptunicella sp. TaxID=2125986 RepID=UPI003F691A66